jgi:hypothetical protein
MKPFVYVLVACVLSGGAALACSPAELTQKQKAYGDAVKAAFARDPGGDGARQARAQAVIGRYGELVKRSSNGAYLIDMVCRENEELLAIYQ